MKYIIVVCALFYACTLNAQVPDTLWTRQYGGSSEDKAYGGEQTSDGGYVIAGYTCSFGAGLMDCYVVKTDSIGEAQWARTYGGSNDDRAYSARETTDGGYIIVGSTKSYGLGSPSIYLIKTNAIGDTIWTKTFAISSMNNEGYSVEQTSDGGYIVGGSTVNHMVMIKTHGNGETQWIREYGTDSYSDGASVQQTSDGGYIIAGRYFLLDNNNFFLVKTDSLGDTLWTSTYGGADNDCCYSVRQTTDGGYIAAGATGILYDRFGADFFLVKTESHGDTLWTSVFGSDNDDVAFSIRQTPNGGYIVVGRSYNIYHQNWDVYIVRTDQQGDTAWSHRYGDYGAQWGESVELTSDGGYIIIGWTSNNECDIWLLKMAPDPYNVEENTYLQLEHSSFTVTPNPSVGRLYIYLDIEAVEKFEVKIHDILGRLITSFKGCMPNSRGPHVLTWDGRDHYGRAVANGAYLVTCAAAGYTMARTVLLMHK
ncbi:MAG: hypothetical protein JSV53_11220 [candidate division WOR-3 bacterium]|nr:MAG: hypothetical protein JSV53_11220 [candidate division WOR-3 bacterium]